MKVGILGGTFNPIHIGHLILAQECWYQLELDRVIFVPAYMPPHKEVEGGVSPADRLNMVRLALEGDKRFSISTYELDSGGMSYSVDTLRHFRDEHPEYKELFFLTGSDSSESFSMWKDPEGILEVAAFVIATRPGWTENSDYEDRVRRIIIPGMEISSSMVRDSIKEKRPIDYMVPSRVVDHIRDKGLYRN